MPAESDLRAALADHARLVALTAEVAEGERILAGIEAERPPVDAAVASATAGLESARAALERARVDHAAADLARHLHPGDDCPVCGNTVSEPPAVDAGALADAERLLAGAEEADRAATAARRDLDARLTAHRARLDVRVAERDTLAARTVDGPAVDQIEAQLASVAAADAALVAARRDDTAARQASAQARARAEAAAARVTAARAEFTAARDRVARFDPPAAGDDLGTDWKVLATWADTTRSEREHRLGAGRRRRDDIVGRAEEYTAELARHAAAAGVLLPAGSPSGIAALRDACVSAAATARSALERLRADRSQAAQLRAQHAELTERRQVHELLAEQLGARGFEAWLLDEALDALLDGASRWLELLSSGRYAMTVDDKNQFAVIDHANADDRRLARTLSGGETFLASLALALALAEQVGELSATGGRSLEAIFLDEGFGTLDPDTLDVVASAIEELGSTGRMVGVVSHVRELAERVPVRFELTKRPGTSVICRVDQ